MPYNRNVMIAAGASLLLHLALLYGIGAGMHLQPDLPDTLSTEPIRIRLTPPPEPEPVVSRQLVETVTPSEVPVETRELIAEADSRASDVEARDSDDPGPAAIAESEFDQLAVEQPETQPEAPAPQAPSMAAAPREMPADPVEDAPAESQDESPPAREPDTRERLAKLIPEGTASAPPRPQPAPPAAATPDQPAEEARPDTQPVLPEGRTQGRARGGVDAVGFVGFEAMQDDIAPYLKAVQKAVELRWREMLLTRYSGVSPTIAEIDCEIAADGSIVRVSAVGTPSDAVYAALCRHAIMKAGPFKPFPFTVPPEYANRNLEIRWTFNFLMLR